MKNTESPSSKPKNNNDKTKPIHDLLSYHAFLLPFKWSKKSADVLTDADFKELVAAIENQADNKWQSTSFDIKTVLRYNEYHYFYDYVSEILYEKDGRDKNVFIKYFEYQGIEGGIYRITLPPDKGKEKSKIYDLEIDSVKVLFHFTLD